MPPLKTYDLFISHAWTYDSQYTRLMEFLKAAPNFQFRNYSVPSHDPIDTQKGDARKQLEEQLLRQIRPVNVVLILSGLYAAHSDWIQYEISAACALSKPIIGIKPWGQERIPTCVSNVAKIMVGWNTDSIVSAIRSYSL